MLADTLMNPISSSSTPIDDINPSYAGMLGTGRVDGEDLVMVLSAWGPCSSCAADLSMDGVVDGGDLVLVMVNRVALP